MAPDLKSMKKKSEPHVPAGRRFLRPLRHKISPTGQSSGVYTSSTPSTSSLLHPSPRARVVRTSPPSFRIPTAGSWALQTPREQQRTDTCLIRPGTIRVRSIQPERGLRPKNIRSHYRTLKPFRDGFRLRSASQISAAAAQIVRRNPLAGAAPHRSS